MKKLTLLIILACIIQATATSQSCLPEGIEFTTQTEIDNFQTNYPNCTEIEGSVIIGHWWSNDINNLNGLSVLTSIGGSLWIGTYFINAIPGGLGCDGNPVLNDITGLSKLTYIGGDLGIFCNDALTNLSGLENLTTIGGSLRIGFTQNDITGVQLAGNSSLTDITALAAVSSIGNDLEIQGNVSLTSLEGLENIDANSIENITIKFNSSLTACDVQSVCDYLSNPGGTVKICNNGPGCDNPAEIAYSCGFQISCLPLGNYYFTSQTEIDSFQTYYQNCTELHGNVTIAGENITNLSGLSEISSISGDLRIISNELLVNLSGLYGLQTIGGDFTIGNPWIGVNPSLINLTGLEGLNSIGGSIIIGGNDALISLQGIENIDGASIQNLSCYNNPSLSNCEVQSICDYLSNPNGDINIHENAPGCNSQEEVEAVCEGTCLPEGINFVNQSQIDNFKTNYPNCTEIEGDVEIGKSNSNISNLNGLNELTSIGGELKMVYLDSLLSLNGLENLTQIGGDLRLVHVDSITNLTGLDNLQSIEGDLYFLGNNNLVSITGLENLDAGTINNLEIKYNNLLSACHVQSICDYLANPNGTVNIHENAPGCNNPPEVANACGFSINCLPYGNYYFTSQDEIDNFQNAYPNCTELNGEVYIEGHSWYGTSNITSLNGLNTITSINGDLTINNNDSLSSLIGLKNLENLQGNLNIGDPQSNSGNASLSDLLGLDNLSILAGNLYIGGNERLQNLTGLNKLTVIGGSLRIKSNDILPTLTGLDSITSIGGSLRISGNLQSLTGLEGLTKITDNVTINITSSLNNLTGLDNITTIGGTFYIDHNSALNNFHGIENLNTIGGDFLIGDNGDAIWHGNPSLRNLTGLENLSSVTGRLVIAYSDSLINMIGLDNLVYVGEGLDIHGNPSLTSLEGLDDLDSIGGYILIYNNISLSTCDIQSICNYLASPNGTVEIHDNAPGCNSSEEVLDSCDFSSVIDFGLIESITVKPNPFTTSTTIEYELSHSGKVELTVYDHLGKQVESIEQIQSQGKQQFVWYALGQPAGVFFCTLKTEYGTHTMKMIKL